MKRYYITRVLGTGLIDDEGNPLDPWYSELRRYVVENWPNEPHFIKQAIHPNVLMWAVMAYDLSDLAHADVLANLTGIFSFPSGSLDTTVAEIPTVKKTAMRTKLENIGFEFTWATSTTTVREILKYLIRSIQLASWAEVPISAANFNLNRTVGDLPTGVTLRIAVHMQDLGIDTSWITLAHTIGEVVQKIQRHDDNSMRLFGVRNPHQWLFQDTD